VAGRRTNSPGKQRCEAEDGKGGIAYDTHLEGGVANIKRNKNRQSKINFWSNLGALEPTWGKGGGKRVQSSVGGNGADDARSFGCRWWG